MVINLNGKRVGAELQLKTFLIFTFPALASSLAAMSRFWFSANYYYVFFDYNRRGLRSRVR